MEPPTIRVGKKRLLSVGNIAMGIAAIAFVLRTPRIGPDEPPDIWFLLTFFNYTVFPAVFVRTVFQTLRRKPLSVSTAVLVAISSIASSTMTLCFLFSTRFRAALEPYPSLEPWIIPTLLWVFYYSTAATVLVQLFRLRSRRCAEAPIPTPARGKARLALCVLGLALVIFVPTAYFSLTYEPPRATGRY